MAEPRRSHHALADGRESLAEAGRLLAEFPACGDTVAARGEIARAVTAATNHCGELIRLLAMEERLGLTAVRGNAQLALRRLEMGGGLNDVASLRTALRAVLAATDRLIRQVEALEAAATDNQDPPPVSS
jgi:hypothetical protein